MFNLASSAFTLHRGPIFTDLLLVDEINRTTARTQAALLEAMEERQATIDGVRLFAGAELHCLRDAESRGVRGNVPASRGAA